MSNSRALQCMHRRSLGGKLVLLLWRQCSQPAAEEFSGVHVPVTNESYCKDMFLHHKSCFFSVQHVVDLTLLIAEILETAAPAAQGTSGMVSV